MMPVSNLAANKNGWVVALDASRNRSGGGKTHLINIIQGGDPRDHGISCIHVWAYKELLDAIPDRPWLVKHNPPELEKALHKQMAWQFFGFPDQFRAAGCNIVLNTDAGTISKIRPNVTMSRDMLSYEPGEIERFGWSKARLRLILLRYVQNRSLRRAYCAVFLTNHAAQVIQQSCGLLERVALIPHGIGDNFRVAESRAPWPAGGERPIRLLYISNAALHKHQWEVVKAVAILRTRGHNVVLQLVGGGKGAGQKLLDSQIVKSDPDRQFVDEVGAVAHGELPKYLAAANIFIFASSCENMPNTLVEAMAAGLPIACAQRGPMPEILDDGGVYFDPEVPDTIAAAIERLIADPDLRTQLSERAQSLSKQYSWRRCARETWSLLADTCSEIAKAESER
jgi:glycosyltransferase involved in cell wall biosynthesis